MARTKESINTGKSDEVESHRMMIEQQSALVQSLNDEINRIARLHALTLGVLVTGISLGVKADVIDLGIAVQNGPTWQVFGTAPLILAGFVGLSEIQLLWRGGLAQFGDWDILGFLPEPFPKYYSDLELEPVPDSITQNRALIESTEERIDVLHLHFLLLFVLVTLWAGVHAIIL